MIIIFLVLVVIIVLIIKSKPAPRQEDNQNTVSADKDNHTEAAVKPEKAETTVKPEKTEPRVEPAKPREIVKPGKKHPSDTGTGSSGNLIFSEPRVLKHGYVSYLMKERYVRYLVHFTPVDNLKNILAEGIVPRACQKNRGVWTDDNRLDHMPDCSCISISFPNYRMFYKKRQTMNKDFAVILIDPYCLDLFPEKDLFFLPHNAASVLYRNSPYKYTGQKALSNMFCDSIMIDDKQIFRKDLPIPKNFTTSPQAELLIRGIIPPSYIREIHVVNHAILNNVKAISSNSLAKVLWCDTYFNARVDYQKWRK